MLLPHEVIPFLQHDDADVRAHAARYLADAHDPAPATADDFWRAIDRFGARQSLELLAHLVDLPQTSASLDRVLETLRGRPDEETDYHLQRAVQWLDFPLLVSRRDEILAAEPILPHVREHLRKRLELADVPADDLWDRLLKASEEADGKPLGQFDSLAADRLIEALARQDKVVAAKAMGRLLEPDEDWMEIFCVQLLGELRHKPATELLIGRLLVEDADVLNEEAVRALARVGTVEVVERLESLYPTQPWGARLYVDDPLAKIKRPESERALLRLLGEEPEDDLRTNLASGLCDLCTTEGLEQVRRLIVEDLYDPQMADLPEELLTVGKMVGYEPPEASQWRVEIDRRRKEIEKRGGTLSLEEMVRDIRDRFRRGEPDWSDPDAADEEDDWTGDAAGSDAWDALDVVEPPPGVTGTIRRDAPKVGRNDPCPCGSGKKYKKCCLEAAQS